MGVLPNAPLIKARYRVSIGITRYPSAGSKGGMKDFIIDKEPTINTYTITSYNSIRKEDSRGGAARERCTHVNIGKGGCTQ